jgi:hypothetical protein
MALAYFEANSARYPDIALSIRGIISAQGQSDFHGARQEHRETGTSKCIAFPLL